MGDRDKGWAREHALIKNAECPRGANCLARSLTRYKASGNGESWQRPHGNFARWVRNRLRMTARSSQICCSNRARCAPGRPTAFALTRRSTGFFRSGCGADHRGPHPAGSGVVSAIGAAPQRSIAAPLKATATAVDAVRAVRPTPSSTPEWWALVCSVRDRLADVLVGRSGELDRVRLVLNVAQLQRRHGKLGHGLLGEVQRLPSCSRGHHLLPADAVRLDAE